MWATIIGVVGKLFADIVLGIFTNEQKVEAEWKVRTYEGKMNSYASSNSVEKAIKKTTAKEVPADGAAWNKGVGRPAGLFLLVCVALLLSGCIRYVYVADRKPEIELPERPTVDETNPFTDRETTLVKYAVDLEAKITTYNEWARRENVKNGYETPDGTNGEQPSETPPEGDEEPKEDPPKSPEGD